MNLLVLYHSSVCNLHDPCHFSDCRESSTYEHVAPNGVPESNSFVVNFRHETSISTLEHKWNGQELHPFLILFGFFTFAIIPGKIDLTKPQDITNTYNTNKIIEFHDNLILRVNFFDEILCRHFKLYGFNF